MFEADYKDQSGATFILTIILAAFACFGLLAVSGWFACELLVFVHYQGRVWLLDAIKDMKNRMIAFALMCWLRIRAGGKEIINYRPLAGMYLVPKHLYAEDCYLMICSSKN